MKFYQEVLNYLDDFLVIIWMQIRMVLVVRALAEERDISKDFSLRLLPNSFVTLHFPHSPHE